MYTVDFYLNFIQYINVSIVSVTPGKTDFPVLTSKLVKYKDAGMKNKWTTGDIRLLRKYYLQQQSLKVMSRLLGRSPTAINKCLTRFKIRPMKPTLFFSLPKKTVKHYGQTHETTQTELEYMVLFYAETVLRMVAQKIEPDRYRVGRQGAQEIMTFAQILLRVNTDRVQRNFPPFTRI